MSSSSELTQKEFLTVRTKVATSLGGGYYEPSADDNQRAELLMGDEFIDVERVLESLRR